MRSSKSRNRNKGNRRPAGNIVNRVFDSSGPEGKVRGTPQQIIDKYQALARDAQLASDRVAVENFQQHAEHYTRMLGEALREQEARREQQEAQHRDRQRERNEQRGQQNEQRGQQNEQREQPAPSEDPGQSPQPDVGGMAAAPLGVVDESSDSGLVETPESKPAPKPRRARKPRPKPEEAPAEAASEPDSETPAAE